MKLSDLVRIESPFTRFVQSTKFLRDLDDTRHKATEIRDKTVLDLRTGKDALSLKDLAEAIGTSPQAIHIIEKRARERYAKSRRKRKATV